MLLINARSLSQVVVVEAAEQPKYGGTLVQALSDDPAHFNRAITASALIGTVSGKMFNSLIQWDTEGNPVPDLAESFEVSKDGLAYTFHLAKNAIWHDGKPFTSADVKFGVEAICEYHPRGKVTLAALDRVDTPDSYTAVIRMKYAAPDFICYLGTTFMLILPKHLYEGTDVLKNEYNLKPVGTGPFKFKEYVKGNHVTLVRNDKYFKKGKPYLDRVVFKIMPDTTSRMNALEGGEVDYHSYYGFPLHEANRVSRLPGIKVMIPQRPLYGNIRLDINVRNPPLDNVKVRQAIAYAINKKEILEKAMYGIGRIATGPVSSLMKWAYDPNVEKYDPDLEKASKLLDEAGYPKGSDGIRFKTSIIYYQGTEHIAKACEIMRLELREVGIDLELRPADSATWQSKVGKWEFDMQIHAAATGPDPLVGTSFHWGENIRNVFATNTGGYKNERYDWLYGQAATEMDQKKRAEYFHEMQEIVAKELPNIWLIEVLEPIAFREEFAGLPEGGYQLEPFDGVWWRKGSDLSPEAIEALIEDSEKQLQDLRGQFYDVGDAIRQLEQAKKALEAGEYVSANDLAKGALKLAQPPYAIYRGIAVATIAVFTAGIFLYRKKRATPTK